MFGFMSRVYLFIILIACHLTSLGQTTYGNDWINPTQPYYKIKVAQKGIFRLNYTTLNQQIPTLGSINPKNFQLFKNGKEVAIYVQGESDNSFDNSDFIEFFGEPNDGTLDKELYTGTQPNTYYSLFTDTAAYFLTINTNIQGARIQNFKASKTGLTSESYVIYESLGVYSNTYYPGKYIIAQMSLSDYQEAEGFMGETYGLGGQQIKTLATPSLYTGIGAPVIKFQTYVAGRSNSLSTNIQGHNHHLRIRINNGSTTSIKKDTLFTGYDVYNGSFSISPNELGTSTQIFYESINDLGVLSDYQAVAYSKITYPRILDLQGTADFNFIIPRNSSNLYLNFSNNNKSKPVIWDVTSGQRIIGEINGNNVEFVLSTNDADRKVLLFDSAGFKSPSISKVEMLNINPNSFDKNFIIVTHKSLINGANNYATYRTQSGYKPYVITTEQLYDQFFYGVHHPLAIRNFSKYLLQYASTKPEYLLLLGKGLENHLIRSSEGLNADLVPTYGSPPSDDLFTARINNSSLAPAIATGRIVAKTNDEIDIYLQKIKSYEQYPDSLWRKKFIHISGGNSLSENLSWAGYQANMYNMAKGEFFGADTVNFHKNINLPISSNRKQNIISEINKGAALLSFLGHGSHQATEIDFSIPEELSNNTKLLSFLVNGCTTGNMYIVAPSLGEKHIMYPGKGAIGWIGTSSEGIASYLSNFSSIFYQKAFNTSYGKSIGTILKETKSQYQNLNDLINVMHTTQYTFQGDPALKFYNPSKPDYMIENKDLFIYPNNVTASADSFSVAIVVKNIGKALNSPLKVSLVRTLPNNTIITYPSQTFTKAVFNTDTLYFSIKSNDAATSAGTNKFTIKLDPDNQYDELSKVNNTASFEYNMLSNGINIIYPPKYGIVPQTNVELVAQSINLTTIGQTKYVFEIDTVRTFNSPWKQSSSLSTGFLPKWTTNLLSKNNQVYYWRAKLDVTIENGGTWQESNFTYIANSPDGWNQSQYEQYKNGVLNSLEFNENTKLLEFAKTSLYTVVQTRGDDAPITEERRYRSNPGGSLGFRPDSFTGFTILALNPANLQELNYPSAFNFQNQDAANQPLYYSGQFYYDTNNSVEVDSLIDYIHKIPQGYYVVGYNGFNINLSALPQNAKDAFLQVGVVNIGNIGAGEPYMFWGQKGAIPGTAIEKMAETGTTIPARSQVIRFDKSYAYPLTQGSYTSAKAGPSKKWKSVDYEVKKEASDQVSFDLLGYNKSGTMQVLQTNLPSNSLDLSNFSAEDYPTMAIRANFTDAINRTPSQIIKWKFLYEGYGEATINPEIKNDFYKEIIQEGDSVIWNIAYQNLSKYPTDSVHVYYTLTKPDRSVSKIKSGTIESLSPGTNTTFKMKLPTIGLVGNNLLKLDFTPINEKDSYSFNNYIQKNFTVTKDTKDPLVEVTFDGKQIMNREIVAPQPNILINLTDENAYRLLNDTTVLDIYLKSESGNYKRIAYSSNLLNFTPANSATNNKATVIYKPNRLTDGIYNLKVEAKDATGNVNGQNSYTIEFEVINESTITHFYPYPNPFTTAMKFVFTLTGDKVPDKIKVQIMTVTGKIVREIFKEELGNIRIGNNISDFTWDGTDMYGDRLANGVYFYKVIIENNDKSEIKHRGTSSDSFFKKNTGKIYLMK